jgi:hypothetical protein
VSIRGYRYWFAVVDVCTKLKLSFGAPMLVAGMKTLDYVLTRECNRVNKDITSIYQLVGEPRNWTKRQRLKNACLRRESPRRGRS